MLDKDELKLNSTLIEFHDDVGFYIPVDSGFFDLDAEDQSILIARARAGISYQELAVFVGEIKDRREYKHDYLFEDYELDQKTRVAIATFRSNSFMSDDLRGFCMDLLEECRKHESSRTISKNMRRAVIARCGTKCAYCKNEFPESKLHIDHFWPYSKGGKTNFNNLIPACPTCNIQKGDKTIVKFLNWRAGR